MSEQASAEAKKHTTSNGEGHQPTLLETTMTGSRVVIILLGIFVFANSLYVGTGVVVAALRGGAALLALGLFAWFVNWFIAANFLAAMRRRTMRASNIAQQELGKKS